jgi:hypothetical protein
MGDDEREGLLERLRDLHEGLRHTRDPLLNARGYADDILECIETIKDPLKTSRNKVIKLFAEEMESNSATREPPHEYQEYDDFVAAVDELVEIARKSLT